MRETESIRAQKRVRFFHGMLLDATAFEAEQFYHLESRRRHNRWLHGSGVATGLGLTLSGTDIVVIEPGMAIDGYGNEIVVPQPVSASLASGSRCVWLVLRYLERGTDPVPAFGADSEPGPEYSRVEESYLLTLDPVQPGERDVGAVAIARLSQHRGLWRIDKRFRPQEAR